MQFNRYRLKLNRINHIFISHLHGDHYLGLVGLISTMHLRHRNQDLTIFGPPGLDDIITLHLKYNEMVLNYKINFVTLDHRTPQVLIDNEVLSVSSFPLSHRVPCVGFLFKEKPKPIRLNKEKDLRKLALSELNQLRSGNSVLDEAGKVKYSLEDYTRPPKKSRSYAYCSDTRYDESLVPHIRAVDLLYHESTFLNDRADRAFETYHSTAEQAATIAKMAGVGHLILGHFSIRYKELSPLLEEAQKVFDNTSLAVEGKKISIED